MDCYIGEIITQSEADKRRQENEVHRHKDVYLFALDKFVDDVSVDKEIRDNHFIVDGEFLAGPTRFINHSCDPNLRIFGRVDDISKKAYHDLAFFAIRDIPRGTELTFDYVDSDPDLARGTSADDPDDVGDKVECRCGARHCRGMLWI